MRRRQTEGFSLIEIISVIAIIAIATSILTPQFFGYIERSRNISDVTEMTEIGNALTSLLSEERKDAGSWPERSGFAYIAVFPKRLAGSDGKTVKVSVDDDPDMSKQLWNELDTIVDLDSIYSRSRASYLKNGYIVFLDIDSSHTEYRVPKTEVAYNEFNLNDALSNILRYDSATNEVAEI